MADRFRVLSIDGGGMRGLIPAMVIAEIERRLTEATGAEKRIADYFHLLAGTSTGGLIALGLTAPADGDPARPRMKGQDLIRLYREHGRGIFGDRLHQLLSLDGWREPKHSPRGLAEALSTELGDATLSKALREVLVTSYDMTARAPYFFKRWRARESDERDVAITDAAVATAAAPTYFPSHEVGGHALVDGGVFASNPTIAAITEALKRRGDEPAMLSADELLVVSLGTGVHEKGFSQSDVKGWGKLEWVKPRDGEAPLVGAIFDGQSDAADHWAHMLLNHAPGDEPPASPEEIGRAGPRYFRLQVRLSEPLGLDEYDERALAALEQAAHRLISERADTIEAIVQRLVPLDPLAPDPHV
jgi:patatin-like phospholipase/acyl hydrolase